MPNDSTDMEFTRSNVDTIRHVEFQITDDGAQHLLWAEDPSDGLASETDSKVMYAFRCTASSAWTIWQPWVSPTLAGTNKDQRLESGRPHMALDDEEDLVHILVPQYNVRETSGSLPTDGDLVWVRRPWGC